MICQVVIFYFKCCPSVNILQEFIHSFNKGHESNLYLTLLFNLLTEHFSVSIMDENMRKFVKKLYPLSSYFIFPLEDNVAWHLCIQHCLPPRLSSMHVSFLAQGRRIWMRYSCHTFRKGIKADSGPRNP